MLLDALPELPDGWVQRVPKLKTKLFTVSQGYIFWPLPPFVKKKIKLEGRMGEKKKIGYKGRKEVKEEGKMVKKRREKGRKEGNRDKKRKFQKFQECQGRGERFFRVAIIYYPCRKCKLARSIIMLKHM